MQVGQKERKNKIICRERMGSIAYTVCGILVGGSKRKKNKIICGKKMGAIACMVYGILAVYLILRYFHIYGI